jgi:hypothetical protein
VRVAGTFSSPIHENRLFFSTTPCDEKKAELKAKVIAIYPKDES